MSQLTRRDFGKRVAASLGSAAVAGTMPYSDAMRGMIPQKPNIVFICSDQHSYRYAGYAGHPLVRTPNLDRIAQQGTVFTDTYCGGPVCVPGRASMMTGMYASDCNSFCNSTVWDGSHPVWGTYLRDAGYQTVAMGKLDLHDAYGTGFREIETSHGHQYSPDITSLFRRPVGYRVNERPYVDGAPRDERHRDARIADMASSFIRSAGYGQPLALYTGFLMPHPRFIALRKYYEMYPSYGIDMPNVPEGHLYEQHLIFQELRHFKLLSSPVAEGAVRRARAAYYGMITELDEYIGDIREALDAAGQLSNTIFIYTSDHGEMLGEHGLWYKNNLYEQAARVPLVMSGPGIPEGKTVSQPVAHVDLVATLLDWAQVPRPAHLRGTSLLPLMHGRPGLKPEFAYSESHSEGNCAGSFAIRKGDWKYIHVTWYEDLLFNVKEDPGEFHNRINDPGTKTVQQEMLDILHAQVDPEEVTIRAFQTQAKYLADMAGKMTESELVEKFRGRLGPGLAQTLAASVKGRLG